MAWSFHAMCFFFMFFGRRFFPVKHDSWPKCWDHCPLMKIHSQTNVKESFILFGLFFLSCLMARFLRNNWHKCQKRLSFLCILVFWCNHSSKTTCPAKPDFSGHYLKNWQFFTVIMPCDLSTKLNFLPFEFLTATVRKKKYQQFASQSSEQIVKKSCASNVYMFCVAVSLGSFTDFSQTYSKDPTIDFKHSLMS